MTPDVNEVAPEFEVVDSTGATQTLSGLVAAARRVLIFYRGHW